MGALGEGYYPLIMRILPASYRVWRSPSARFDAMIFVSDAHPTEIKERSTAALDNLVTAIRQAEAQNKENEDSEEESWKAALAEDLLEKYGVIPEYYVDLGEGIYQVYVEVGGEIVPFVTVDSATGDYHG